MSEKLKPQPEPTAEGSPVSEWDKLDPSKAGPEQAAPGLAAETQVGRIEQAHQLSGEATAKMGGILVGAAQEAGNFTDRRYVNRVNKVGEGLVDVFHGGVQVASGNKAAGAALIAKGSHEAVKHGKKAADRRETLNAKNN